MLDNTKKRKRDKFPEENDCIALDKDKAIMLRYLESYGFSRLNIYSMLAGFGANISRAFDGLKYLVVLQEDIVDSNGNKVSILNLLISYGFTPANISSMLIRSGANISKAINGLKDFLVLQEDIVDSNGNKVSILNLLISCNFTPANISSMLAGSGANISKAINGLKYLVVLQEDIVYSNGNKASILNLLISCNFTPANISSMLAGFGANISKAINRLKYLVVLQEDIVDSNGNKASILNLLISCDFTPANISSMLAGSGANISKAINGLKYLVVLQEDIVYSNGNKASILNLLISYGFTSANIFSMLAGSGANISEAINGLKYLVVLQEDIVYSNGNKASILNLLISYGFTSANISSMLAGSGANISEAINWLKYLVVLQEDIVDSNGNKVSILNLLISCDFTPANISSMLIRSKTNISRAINRLKYLVVLQEGIVDLNGNKISILNLLISYGFTSANISSMLIRSGANISKAINGLKYLVVLQEDIVDLNGNKASILNLLISYDFTPANISSMLAGSGANISKAINGLKYLVVLQEDIVDSNGNKAFILNLLISYGFTSASISSMLIRPRTNISNVINRLKYLVVSQKDIVYSNGNKVPILNLLISYGFTSANISSMLAGSGANISRGSDWLKDFVVLQEDIVDSNGNKASILNLLISCNFTPANISSMLAGSGADISEAINGLKYLVVLQEDIVDSNGNKVSILNLLISCDFTPANISSMLAGSGANISKAINGLKYLVVLQEDIVYSNGNKASILNLLISYDFTPANISSMLAGSGANISKAINGLKYLVVLQEGIVYSNGNKASILNLLISYGFTSANISSMLAGSGANISEAINGLKYLVVLQEDIVDSNGNKASILNLLISYDFTPANISSMLIRSGANISKAINGLKYLVVLQEGIVYSNGNKASILNLLISYGFTPANISSELKGAGANISKAINGLKYLVVLQEGIVDSNGNKASILNLLISCNFTPANIFSMLAGSGANISKAINGLKYLVVLQEDIVDSNGNKASILNLLISCDFTPAKISSELKGAGANINNVINRLKDLTGSQVGSVDSDRNNKPSIVTLNDFPKKQLPETTAQLPETTAQLPETTAQLQWLPFTAFFPCSYSNNEKEKKKKEKEKEVVVGR